MPLVPIWASAVLAGICGAIVGSYVGVIVVRWPRAEQTMRGRSMCDRCGRSLGWLETVPLLSWLFLRGRCRQCDAPIDRVQPLCEGAGALIGFVAFAWLAPIQAAAWSALLILLLPIALLDARHFWLPDRLTAALAVGGLLAGGLTSSASPLTDRVVGAAIAYLLLEGIRRAYRAIRHREGMGAGDPKLAAAIALWFAPFDLPLLLLAATFVGFAIAVPMHRRAGTTRLPFGTCLAVAVALVPLTQHLLALPTGG